MPLSAAEKMRRRRQKERPKVTWYDWKESNSKISKLSKTGTIMELITHILEMTPSFFHHSCIKRCQADSYQKDKLAESLATYDPSVVLLQVDFAENYTCIAQDEDQSFHWVQPQVALFTASLWHSGVQHPIVFVSDDRQHNKTTAVVYINKILKSLPASVKLVRIWSDRPVSQFKNRFIAESIKLLEERNEKHLIWNYFATSHGKGPVDCIGGALKRFVRSQVFVFNSEQFAEAAKDSSIEVVNVSPEEIKETVMEMHLEDIFFNAPMISGISKKHAIRWYNGHLQLAETSTELSRSRMITNIFHQKIYSSGSDNDDNIPLATRFK